MKHALGSSQDGLVGQRIAMVVLLALGLGCEPLLQDEVPDASSLDMSKEDMSDAGEALDIRVVADLSEPLDLSEVPDIAVAQPDVGIWDMRLPRKFGCDVYKENEHAFILIQLEDLDLAQGWSVEQGPQRYTGRGYLSWKGSQEHLDEPGRAVLQARFKIETPGRYNVVRKTLYPPRVDQPVPSNIAWFRLPDAAAFYGLQRVNGQEVRRYPKLQCLRVKEMEKVRALADVRTADCVRGVSEDGWLRVYSLASGGFWWWDTKTSREDPSEVVVEFDRPGIYTLEISAAQRDVSLDKLAIYPEDEDQRTVFDDDLPPSPCEK